MDYKSKIPILDCNQFNKTQQQMFDWNHCSFEFSDFTDDFKNFQSDLPTTTHNSPKSMKSQFLHMEDSPLNCSFDENLQSEHAQVVWQASVKYLTCAVKDFLDLSKGFNDQQLYGVQLSKIGQETLDQLVLKNTLLKIQQRHELIGCLREESQLMKLMKELSSLFNQEVFHEISYVIYKIWQKKKTTELQVNRPEEQLLIPHFDCFWGYEDQENLIQSYSLDHPKSYIDIIHLSEKCSQEIAYDIYFDSKLKFLNLANSKKQVANQQQLSALFTQFFLSLSHSVYLSSQGFFNQPSTYNSEQQSKENLITKDFQFQFNEVNALKQLEERPSKFVRSFYQCLEDDEEMESGEGPTKKRKLQ